MKLAATIRLLVTTGLVILVFTESGIWTALAVALLAVDIGLATLVYRE